MKMKMKMNAKGEELYDIWEQNYRKENDRLGGNSADGDYVEGWCIIDNDEYIKNITDECGLLIFGYYDDAMFTVAEWIEDWGNERIKIGSNYYTYEDIIKELSKYFEAV